MRTIYFRGKRLKRQKGAWVFGNLCVCSAGTFIGSLNPGVEVDPETVGQYTGYKDHSGKDIYEGDILYCLKDDMKHAFRSVVYQRGCFCLHDWFASSPMVNHFIKSWKVVGNIFDNPELVDIVNGRKKGGEQ